MTSSPLARAIHVAGLFALAVAHPILDLLGAHAQFFVARDSHALDIWLLVLGLCAGVPALLFALEAGAARLSDGLGRGLHLALVGLLIALLALLAVPKTIPSPAAWGVAVLAGAAGAAAYARFAPLQTLLGVLGVAPLAVAVLFLLRPDVGRLLSSGRGGVEAKVRVERPAPVVLIVFDEFSGLSLMDEKGDLDAARYPHFAELAKSATWFRNATTVNFNSELAVPAILTGRYPLQLKLQTFDDYPENLFTLLGETYRVVNFETLTRLCPPAICSREASSELPLRTRLASLVRDLAVVYGHLVLPEAQASLLPPIGDRWGGFGAESGTAEHPTTGALLPDAGGKKTRNVAASEIPTVRSLTDSDRAATFDRFLDALGSDDGPALYFLHILVPHTGWRYLPSGRDYALPGSAWLDGTSGGSWVDDEWLASQGQQRYLLQVGFADTLVGKLIERLKQRGLYDRALVVITADHGVSSMPGEGRRVLGEKGYPELLLVPFFVKQPGQTQGAVSDRNVETIDVLPTIADSLGVRIPWPVDGFSALDGASAERPSKRFVDGFDDNGPLWREFDKNLPEKEANLRRLIEIFGTGTTRPEGVWAIGPYHALVGQPVPADLPRLAGASIRLDTSAYLDVDLAGRIPARVTGSVAGASTGAPTWVAIALNGRIAAVTRTTTGRSSFTAMVQDRLLHQGRNEIEALIVREEDGEVRLFRAEG